MISVSLKRILTVLSLLFFSISSLQGQNLNQPSLQISSDPDGASVTLSGDMIVSGISPVSFHLPLAGRYDLEISKFGYEKFKSDILIDPAKPMVFSVSLSKKTKFKSTLRSVFFPGWGQKYFDQSKKGTLFSLLAIGSVTAYFIFDADFDDKYDEYAGLIKEYDSTLKAGNITELKQIKTKLDKSQQTAYDAENNRRIAIGSVIAIWGINVLDAFFFSPEVKGTISYKSLSVKPEANLDGQIGIKLLASF